MYPLQVLSLLTVLGSALVKSKSPHKKGKGHICLSKQLLRTYRDGVCQYTEGVRVSPGEHLKLQVSPIITAQSV